MKAHEVLSKHGVRSKKGLGQHFLVDERAILRIVEAADLDEGDTVLEIGPGPGTLTPRLAERAGRVIAVEIDERMLAPLREFLAGRDNVRIVRADILDQDLCQLVGKGPYKVVANLPYYITSAVLRHLLESPCRPHALIVTVQREVAERIVARAYAAKSRPKHATKMSLLAVSVQFYGQPRIVARIPAGAFRPVPAVDSAVVRIDTYAQLPWDVDDVGALAMLHAERLTRLLADVVASEVLLDQVKKFPEREEVLKSYLDRAEPRCRYLYDEITSTGGRILEKLKSNGNGQPATE